MFRGKPDQRRNHTRWNRVIFRIKTKIQFFIGQGKVKFILSLLEAIGVRGWRTLSDPVGNPEPPNRDAAYFFSDCGNPDSLLRLPGYGVAFSSVRH